MPGPPVPQLAAYRLWGLFHPAGSSLWSGPAELSEAAGLFQHRPRGHHGRGAGLRRQTGRAGRRAAHALPWAHQTVVVLYHGQYRAGVRLALLSKSPRRDPCPALDRRIAPGGHLGRHRHPALQYFPKRIHRPKRRPASESSLGRGPVHRRRGDYLHRLPNPYGQHEPGRAAGDKNQGGGMSLENGRHGGGGRRGGTVRVLAPGTPLRAGPGVSSPAPRCPMNVLASLRPVVTDLTDKFGTRIANVQATRPNEIYFHAPLELVAGFCAQVYKKWNGRLVSLFADDARRETQVFHLYYVFALDDAHGFVILRVPVPEQQAIFPSLTNALPAANWQEREVQD